MGIFFPLIFIFPISALNSSCFFNIPQNEQVADALVEQGKLDPSIWEIIKPYYAQPIDVPQGELGILMELFPQLPSDLPVSSDSLARYSPWDESAKMRFFNDFPILAQFEPILCFEIKSAASKLKTSFSINGQNLPRSFSQSMNLLFCLSDKFKLDTRVKFTDDYARWYRRASTFTPSEKCSLQIGNFGSSFDRGLFFGYFPPEQIFIKHSLNNWLYGNAATWNGFNIRVAELGNDFLSRFSGYSFFHKRETETAYGSILKMLINEKINISAGMSSLNVTEDSSVAEYRYYVHSGIKMNFNSFRSEIQTGLDLKDPLLIPVYIENRFIAQGKECNITVIVLPEGFNAPCSFLARRINQYNDTVDQTITSVYIQSKYRLLRWLSVLPSIDLAFTKDRTESCHLGLSVSGSFSKLIYDLDYSWTPSCTQSDSTVNSFYNMLSVIFLNKITLKSELDATILNHGNYNVNGSISARLDLFQAIAIKPSVSFSRKSNKKNFIGYGIRQILCLRDRTFTEVFLEKSVNPKIQREILRVEAKTSFLF